MRRWVIALALVLGLGRAGAVELPVVTGGPRVTVRAQDGLDKQARRAAAEAAGDLAEIEEDLEGLPRVASVEIRLVKHMEDVAEAAPAGRGAPEWASGTAYPDLGVVVVAARGRTGELLDMDRTLAHELAHMALSRAFGENEVPRWLTEGFAYLHSSDFSFARGRTLVGAVVSGRLLPLAGLERAFPAGEDEAALAYAESYSFVAFLAHRGRNPDLGHDRAAFQRFLAEVAHGAGVEAAARAAYGRRLADLEGEWLEAVRADYFWYPVSIGGALFWVAGALFLFLGWLRRRRQARRRLAQWEVEEAAAEAAEVELKH